MPCKIDYHDFRFIMFTKSDSHFDFVSLRGVWFAEFDRIGMTNSIGQISWSCLVHGMLTKESFKFLQPRISSFHTITHGIHWNLPSPLSFSPSMAFSSPSIALSFQIFLRFGLGFRFYFIIK